MSNYNTVVKIGNMASTNVDAYLKTVQIKTEVQNGSHVSLGSLVSGELDTYEASTPTAVETEEVLLIESPVIIEVNGMRIDLADPRKFTNPANRSLRARHLKVGDTLTMSIEGFSSTPTAGKYAIPANGTYKLAPSSTIGNATLSYKVESRNDISIGSGYQEAYLLRVVKSV